MFSKILIANRGEIAHRIIRACKELGIETVAVYSEADAACLHLKLADETVCIGPAVSAKSYLNIDSIIKAAKEKGAAAVHPGYGYLAENEQFATACHDAGITFIGPTPQNLKLAGDKLGYNVTIDRIENPRIEKEDHYYNVQYTGLMDLGLKPHYLTDDILEGFFRIADKFRDRINRDAFFRGIKWKLNQSY